MTNDDIKKAAIELCTTEAQEEWLRDYGIHCCIDGVLRRIENAWHDITQQPKDGKLIICQGDYGLFMDRPKNKNFSRIVESFNVTRWAYIADLMPDRKEAEQ